MNKMHFIIIGFFLYAVIILSMGGLLIYRRNKRKKITSFFVNNQNILFKNFLLALYDTIEKIPLLNGFLKRVKRRYEILTPGDISKIKKKSVIYTIIISFFSLLIIFCAFFLKPTLYRACLTVLLIWVINSKVTRVSIRYLEKKILKQLDLLISDIRHNYYIKGSVEDALLYSIDLAGKEMKIHANKIYEIITSENIDEEIMKV